MRRSSKREVRLRDRREAVQLPGQRRVAGRGDLLDPRHDPGDGHVVLGHLVEQGRQLGEPHGHCREGTGLLPGVVPGEGFAERQAVDGERPAGGADAGLQTAQVGAQGVVDADELVAERGQPGGTGGGGMRDLEGRAPPCLTLSATGTRRCAVSTGPGDRLASFRAVQ